MARIIDNRNTMDQTIRIFDNFYSFKAVINPSEYDLVHSYFMGVCGNKNVANNFTAALFRISQYTGMPIGNLLDYLRGHDNNNTDVAHMNKVICYFLNTMKSKTAMYGVSQIPRPNQPVARNILQ